jgi:hypothetical protein
LTREVASSILKFHKLPRPADSSIKALCTGLFARAKRRQKSPNFKMQRLGAFAAAVDFSRHGELGEASSPMLIAF